MLNPFRKKRKVTLVLGGGSARGLAHIGILKIFEREKIPIDNIVGTSMGALIGASYSIGTPTWRMEEMAHGFSVNKLLDPVIPRMGLLAGDKLEATIRELLDDCTFADCKIPLAVVATDIQNGEEVVYQKGALVKVVRASCSWPGIFNPVMIDGRVLSDGGLKNSVPTRVAKNLEADYIIAVNVGFCVKTGKIENIMQMIIQSIQIMGEELNKCQTGSADAAIEVDLGPIDQTAFEKAKEIIQKGVAAAELRVAGIKKDLGL